MSGLVEPFRAEVLRGIFAISSEAIIVTDSQRRILMFSVGAETIFGYRGEEVIGQPVEQLMPERFRTAHRRHVAGFAAQSRQSMAMLERGQVVGRRKNGEEFLVEASLSKVSTPEGLLFTTIIRDVTQRRHTLDRIVRSEERLRIALQSADLHVFEIDYTTKTIFKAGAEDARRENVREVRLMIIRPEKPEDSLAIRALTDAAFVGVEHSSQTEGAIVDALRAADALAMSLVAEQDGSIIGHVAFSPVLIDGEDTGWFGLGPVSVSPSLQRRGVGSMLINEGLGRLATHGAQGCVVLGDPKYYSRFGFRSDHTLSYGDVPPAYFQSLVLAGAPPSGEVTYDAGFEAT